jgi:hypothetical protein
MEDQKEDGRRTRSAESRHAEVREYSMRPAKWAPAQLLPDPEPEPGWAFRWIRLSTLNNSDPTNISSKLREGWEPVKASTQPKLRFLADPKSRFPDSIEIGGLLLCKTPVEFTEDRDEYYRKQSEAQMASVDNTYMRESDPRMPLFKERSSKVTFGKGI